jgi:hypothetical protein
MTKSSNTTTATVAKKGSKKVAGAIADKLNASVAKGKRDSEKAAAAAGREALSTVNGVAPDSYTGRDGKPLAKLQTVTVSFQAKGKKPAYEKMGVVAELSSHLGFPAARVVLNGKKDAGDWFKVDRLAGAAALPAAAPAPKKGAKKTAAPANGAQLPDVLRDANGAPKPPALEPVTYAEAHDFPRPETDEQKKRRGDIADALTMAEKGDWKAARAAMEKLARIGADIPEWIKAKVKAKSSAKGGNGAKAPKAAKPAAGATVDGYAEGSVKAQVLAMLLKGATEPEISAAIGWKQSFSLITAVCRETGRQLKGIKEGRISRWYAEAPAASPAATPSAAQPPAA